MSTNDLRVGNAASINKNVRTPASFYHLLCMSEAMYELKGPAQEDGVLRLRGQYPNLPADYFSFLLRSDGGEGFVGVSPGYFNLWSANDVANFSSEYQVHIYLPGYVAVGSSGGGDLYVFPVSGWPPGLFVVPAIGMDLDCVQLVSRSFSAFVAEFGKQWLTPA